MEEISPSTKRLRGDQFRGPIAPLLADAGLSQVSSPCLRLKGANGLGCLQIVRHLELLHHAGAGFVNQSRRRDCASLGVIRVHSSDTLLAYHLVEHAVRLRGGLSRKGNQAGYGCDQRRAHLEEGNHQRDSAWLNTMTASCGVRLRSGFRRLSNKRGCRCPLPLQGCRHQPMTCMRSRRHLRPSAARSRSVGWWHCRATREIGSPPAFLLHPYELLLALREQGRQLGFECGWGSPDMAESRH